jgi:hypothetical protein
MPFLPNVLVALRSLLHGSDRSRAVDEERAAAERHMEGARSLERRLRAGLSATGAEAIELGTSVEHGWKVAMPARRLGAHMLLVGPTGCGKSRFVVLILKGLLAAGEWRAVFLDPKAEGVELSKRAVVAVGRALPTARRQALYRSVVQVDLFGTRSLPRLNVLALQPGLDPEVQAYEVALLLTAELDQGVGVRQEAILHRVIECLIRAALPLTTLPVVLEAPAILERLAERCGPFELFRSTADRLRRESKERVLGLQSRAERVLRLKTTRLSLGAPDCLDASALLDLIALVGLSAPHGAADVSRMIAGILWLLLSHAIRRRENGAPTSHLVIDEFPTFLLGGGAHMASTIEELLRLARSKGVYLTALSQDMVSLGKASSSLPEVLRANIHCFGIFRSVTDSAWDFVLPVTGRRAKPKAAPWEEERGGFLERSAELTLLRQELARLPDRELMFADRRTGLPGVRLRTADLHLDATSEELAELGEASCSHPMLSSVEELERHYDGTMRRLRELLGAAERGCVSEEDRGPVRRARGKLGLG